MGTARGAEGRATGAHDGRTARLKKAALADCEPGRSPASRGTLSGLAMLGARRLLGALRLCSSVSCPRPRASAKMRVRDALRVQDASGECVTVQVGVWKDCCLSLLDLSCLQSLHFWDRTVIFANRSDDHKCSS